MFNLLIADKKVNSLEQLKENFDFEAVKLYFLGGSLVKWLEERGKTEIAERVKGIDLNKDIDAQLAEIFEQPAPIKADLQKVLVMENVKKSLSSFVLAEDHLNYAISANCSSFLNAAVQDRLAPVGSFGENMGSFVGSGKYFIGSFEYALGSFEYNLSSFKYYTGSHQFESEYETGSFSLRNSSFGSEQSSFGFFSTSFSYNTTSFSYNQTSFNTSSFNLGSYANSSALSSFVLSSFAPFSSGHYDMLNDYSSFNNDLSKQTELKEEYKTAEEKICENLAVCPLNRFGYGLHLI